MRINEQGEETRGGVFGQFLGNIEVQGASISSVTFSGLDGDSDRQYGIRFRWQNPLALSKRLDIRPNGAALPSTAWMAREQWERTVGIREDRTDPDFTIGDLVGAVADTICEGSVTMHCTRANSTLGFFIEVHGYCRDSAVLFADRERVYARRGIWGDQSSNITSLTIQIGDGSAAIKEGSTFWLFGR